MSADDARQAFGDGLGLVRDSPSTLAKIRRHFSTVHYKTLMCPCLEIIDEDLCPYGPDHSPLPNDAINTCVFAHSIADLRHPWKPPQFQLEKFEAGAYRDTRKGFPAIIIRQQRALSRTNTARSNALSDGLITCPTCQRTWVWRFPEGYNACRCPCGVVLNRPSAQMQGQQGQQGQQSGGGTGARQPPQQLQQRQAAGGGLGNGNRETVVCSSCQRTLAWPEGHLACRCPCGQVQRRLPGRHLSGQVERTVESRAPSAEPPAGTIVQCPACQKHLRWPGGPQCRCPCGKILGS